MAQSPLLIISRELRDLIYLEVLAYSALPPPSPDTCTNRKRGGWGFNCGDFFMDECNEYPVKPSFGSTAILFVNHQIHDEVKDIISSKHLKTLPYKLDCMLVDETRVYPTWTAIPIITSEVEAVEVTLRLFGRRDAKQCSGWQDGCGGPNSMIWGLFELLRRFMSRGPDFLAAPTKIEFKIGALILNVVTPDEPDEGFMAEEQKIFYEYLEEFPGGFINPKTIVNMLRRNTNRLLFFPEGDVARQGLGSIRLRLDGKEKREWIFPRDNAGEEDESVELEWDS